MTNPVPTMVAQAKHGQNFLPDLPQQILALLPLTLFFQIGVMYGGLFLFLLAWLLATRTQAAWFRQWCAIRQSPLFIPVLALLLLSLIMSLIHPHPENEFAAAFLHYQSYLLLFPLLAIGAGAWQQRAIHYFFLGTLIASTLFYLNSLGVLPDIKFFRSYTLYEGNKSILLALLLALGAAWMLHEWRLKRDHAVWRALAFIYVSAALILCAKSRTASLLFVILCGILVCRNFSFRWWQMAVLGAVVVAGIAGVNYAAQMPAPVTCLAKEMHDAYHLNGAQILVNRAICTVHQVRDFGKTKQVSEDGMRLEIYLNTWEMIQERPLLGHGIGNWLAAYQAKAKGEISEKMTTPHNDYLLYFFELGLLGVLSLLVIFLTQLKVARDMVKSEHQERAMLLVMVTVTMMFSALFNAILRDGVFAFAMMILLAIPLAGVKRG